jgi:sigma-B regulation protein RsbU (phosphoserine phosphatase)
VNRVLSGRFEGRFVTAACIYLDADGPLARYSLAGHPPPLLRQHATGKLVELREGGLPLGLFPDVVYPTAAVAFEPGDRLLLYTDGLTDVRDRSGAWFGDGELGPFMAASRAASAGGFLDALMSHLDRWSGREPGLTEDDLTAVVIDRR